MPACNLSDLNTWPFSHPGHAFEGSESLQHYDSQVSGQYYLAERLQQSCHRATDIEDADLVLVSAHCYTMWFVACIHGSHCQEQHDSYYLGRLLRAVVKSERFQRTRGKDYLFYRTVVSDVMFEGLWEQTLAGIHVVNERGQLESAFQDMTWDKTRYFVAPYSSTNDPPPFQPELERNTRVFFQGGCASDGSPGKALRQRLVDVFDSMNLSDTNVVCACAQCPGHASHAELMEALQKSVFCLLPTGDTQSSRRLTEIILAGCIPVFVGPPYHSLPFAQDVDYKSFAVFFNVTSLESLRTWWHDQSPEGYTPPERLDVLRNATNVQTLEDIAISLTDGIGLTNADIIRRQKAMLSFKSRFSFNRVGGDVEPDAVTTIINNVCQVARQDRVI